MNKTVKIWSVVGAILVVLGMILFASVMAIYDWDFAKLSTDKYVTNTYTAKGEFDKISINVSTAEIKFALTEDEECRIVCFETENVTHSVTVQNNTLIIDTRDSRKWYEHIGIFLEAPQMTIYLPQNEYTSLFIETNTGDITIPKDFSIKTLKIDGDTSDVECFASVFDTIEVKVSTGNINVDTIVAGELNLTTDTGDIKVISATVKNKIDIKTDTGNVKLENSDATQISVETSTGDVTGTLLSEKIFITETSTGKVRVPKTTSGGKCEITTSTGDIKIDVIQ